MPPSFKITRLIFSLCVTKPIRLPQFRGAALRGGFGTTFRRMVCAQKLKEDCRDCMLRLTCSYSVIFSTPNYPGNQAFEKNDSLARPFILEFSEETKGEYRENEILKLKVTLIGRAIEYFPYFFIVIKELGQSGFGAKVNGEPRGEYEIAEIFQLKGQGERSIFKGDSNDKFVTPEPEIIPESDHDILLINCQQVKINFLTPCRIKYQGSLRSVMEFHVILRNILRRISMLHFFDTGNPLTLDYRGIIDRANEIQIVESQLKWLEFNRYSTRQDTEMKLGGVVGFLVYSGPVAEFYPYLKTAEYLNVGKGITFGFGKIQVDRV